MFPKKDDSIRKSYMELGTLYFWTATINGWNRLLMDDRYKDEIISSLHTLSAQKKIQVFGFVIMPNHIHLIWRILAMNAKESPQGSLLKFTAHRFKSRLIATQGVRALAPYAVKRHNKSYEFWQRDSLAIPLFTMPVLYRS